MKLLLLLPLLLCGCASSFDTVSLSVGYGKASVSGTVHLKDYRK